MSTEYVNMIAKLLENGEERLVSAVETGFLPLNLVIKIAKTDAKGAHKALMSDAAGTRHRLTQTAVLVADIQRFPVIASVQVQASCLRANDPSTDEASRTKRGQSEQPVSRA